MTKKATRPVFFPAKQHDRNKPLFGTKEVTFAWHAGLAPSQKQKSLKSFHEESAHEGFSNLLEISTLSVQPQGYALSAFHLLLFSMYGHICVESAYQGSKVFEGGISYPRLYGFDGLSAKKYELLKKSGKLEKFVFEGVEWGLEPQTAFYDWLYLKALDENKSALKGLMEFDGFTDIAFNPKKSISTQARTCAIAVALVRFGLWDRALEDKKSFMTLVYPHRSDSLF